MSAPRRREFSSVWRATRGSTKKSTATTATNNNNILQSEKKATRQPATSCKAHVVTTFWHILNEWYGDRTVNTESSSDVGTKFAPIFRVHHLRNQSKMAVPASDPIKAKGKKKRELFLGERLSSATTQVMD